MWCDRCQKECEQPQTTESGGSECSECGSPLRPSLAETDELDTDPIRLFEDLNDEVLVGTKTQQDTGPWSDTVRVDPAHPLTLFPADPRLPREPAVVSKGRSFTEIAAGAAGFLGSVFGYLGILGLMLGAGLLWYGNLENRPELEQSGWMTVMAGQVGLLLGWAALLWSGSQNPDREILRRLDQVSERLSTLETNASMSNSAAPSFYNHLAAGAPTQMLLTDLKGQLDLLATRLNRDDSNRL